MWLYFYLVISLAPAVYTFWRVSGTWAWGLSTGDYSEYPNSFRKRDQTPNGSAIVCGICMGVLAAAIWPILFVVFSFGKGALYTPKDIKIQRYERRIKELEKRTGINV